MTVEFYQDNELMVLDCIAVEKATEGGDIIITFSDKESDYLIIDRENFFGVYAKEATK